MGLIKIRSDIKKLELTLAELQQFQEKKRSSSKKKTETKEEVKSNGSSKQ